MKLRTDKALFGNDDWQITLTMFDEMQNAIILVHDGLVRFVNLAAYKLLGFEDGATPVKQPLVDLFPKDYKDLMGLDLSILAEEDKIPVKFSNQNDAIIDVEMTIRPASIAQGFFLIEARDISENLRVARALQLREQRLENILNTVADGIITIKPDGVIETCNPAAETIFGFGRGELMGAHFPDLIQDTIFNGFCRQGKTWIEAICAMPEVMGCKSDGTLFMMELSVREMAYLDGVRHTAILRDVTERKEREKKIRHLAHHDTLTGLPNRYLFDDRLDTAVERARRHKENVVVMFIDLDKFKPINDTFGHAVGDEVLKLTAKRLSDITREMDTVARIGGDEFVGIFEDLKNHHEISILAEKVLASIVKPMTVENETHQLGASIGFAVFPEHAQDAQNLLQCADVAMYRVKQSGRNGYAIFDEGAQNEIIRLVV